MPDTLVIIFFVAILTSLATWVRKPVNDLSRGALVDDIVYTIALTAIQSAQQQ